MVFGVTTQTSVLRVKGSFLSGALIISLGVSSTFAQRPLGIDVSSYQGSSIDWVSVKTSGVSFAWCKATEGVTFVDSTFTINMANARAAGVLIGAYHFARPDLHLGPAGAAQEATNCWNVVSNYLKGGNAYLMPVLDIEQNLSGATPAYTKATLSQWVNAWCSNILQRAAANGVTVTPVVYTYVSYASTWLDGSVTQWPLWMAQYPASPNPQTGAPSSIAPWSSWRAWQYSSTGTVPGVPGNCDLDVFNGTMGSLAALVIGGIAPPAITSEPSDRFADPGGTLALSVTAEGVAPLHYQWRAHGTNLPGATNRVLTLTPLQPADAGLYAVVVTNAGGSVTSRLAQVTINPPYAPVFADDFDVNSAANWRLNRASTDNRATFAYNYAPLGIPAAPHATNGSTKGLRLEANLTAGNPDALSLSPVGQAFPPVCRLRFDVWLNVNGPLPNGGAGSTQAITAGVGTSGDHVQWNAAASGADGVWFAVDGEGGVADTSTGVGDFLAGTGTNTLGVASGVYAAGTGSTARGNFDAYYGNVFPGGQTAPGWQQTNYPQQSGALSVGTIGFAWRELIVSRHGATVDWFIDGLRMASVTNAALTASNVFVGYWDPFASLSDNTNLSFGLVDNLRVEVPAVAPQFVTQPANQWAQPGSSATFIASATGLPAPAYQWRLNGTNLAGATAATLVVTHLTAASIGNYSVVVSNLAGGQASTNAALALQASTPPQLEVAEAPATDTLPLLAAAEVGVTYTLETSTNLITWETVTNVVATGPTLSFTPPFAPSDAQRFYRLRSGP